ncbi:MAG: cation-transporting P-type ATPase [Clostridiales bacterium]|nr:cation-transporting P-type ATPase [Clostridiales bacterium]
MNETWYDKSIEQLEKRFSTDRGVGLKRSAAAKTRREYGANNIYPTPTSSFFGYRSYILPDFASLLLLVVAAVAAIFEVPVAAGAIVLMLIINYIAAVFTFVKAQRVLEGMAAYSLPTAKVMRDGKLSLVDMRSLVPGDVIFLSAGDIVPADCRIFAAENFFVNEAILTGVQTSVRKDANFSYFAPGLAPERQLNMAFAATIVTAGNARCIVAATGDGALAASLGKTKPIVTHENLHVLTKLKKYCSIWSMTMLAIIFAVTIADLFIGYGDNGVFDVFLTGISLAAASMSELFMAFGYIIIGCGIFNAMKRRRDINVGALIKNAEKLEQLKQLDVLIVPKDGMITQSHAFADKIYLPRKLYSATDIDRVDKLTQIVLRAVISTGIYSSGLASLNSSSRRITPEEESIINLASELKLYNANIDRAYPIIEHKSAGGASKFDTTLTLDPDRHYFAVCRGGAEEILNSCEYFIENRRTFHMSTDDRLAFLGAAESLTKNSYKVVAVASGTTGYNNLQRIGAIQSDLVFEGLIAIREPLQSGVAQTIERCRAAGIRVIMTTERYTESDKYLAISIGIIKNEREILTENRLLAMNRDMLRTNLSLYNMYCGIPAARLAELVAMLREDGHHVGLLAGGINGALLLRQADVGFAQSVTISPKASHHGIDIRSRQTPAYSRIANPNGKTFDSEALKFISDVVVSDADEHGDGGIAAVVSALEYSRSIYKNLLRIVRYLVTVQFARIFLILGANFAGVSALSPEQLIFGGLIFDFAAVISSAFAKPPHDALTMRDDAEQALDHVVITNLRPILYALFEAVMLLSIDPLLTYLNIPLGAEEYSSLIFISFTLFQLMTLTELGSDRSLLAANMRVNTIYALLVVGLVGFIAAGILIPSFGAIFGITALSPLAIGICAIMTLMTFALHEIYKLIVARKK